jgi:DNA adenine methylase
MKHLTPLRYPGGKAHLGPFFGDLVWANGLSDGAYVEPYAGGAGVGVSLLLGEYVDVVWINDLDPAVWAFWHSVINNDGELRRRIESAPLTLPERARQKAIYRRGLAAGVLPLGFAFFFLNRTNRSGILDGGVIGGKKQKGEWKIDARFNREELSERVRRIARYRNRLHVYNQDALPFLHQILGRLPRRALLYLDPPYYDKGRHLYANYYTPDDHQLIATAVKRLPRPWVVSYDDRAQTRRLYAGYQTRRYHLSYSARDKRRGAEIMFFARGVTVPRSLPGRR